MPDEMVSPMPARVSIDVMRPVALSRSPPTPAELSPPNNMRSPASDARAHTTSISQSVRQSKSRSTRGIQLTKPPTGPRFSMVAMSITSRRRSR